MPRCLSSFCDGEAYPDHVGHHLPDEAARQEAMHRLPTIAKDFIRTEGDKQGYVVLVTGEDSKPVFSATLSDAGVLPRARGKPTNSEMTYNPRLTVGGRCGQYSSTAELRS